MARLADRDPRLRVLNMSRAQLKSTPGLLDKLSAALCTNSIVEEVVLDECELGSEGVAAVARGLSANTSVASLGLREAGVTVGDIPVLTRLLLGNTTLLTIDVEDRAVAAAIHPLLRINREMKVMPAVGEDNEASSRPSPSSNPI